MYKIQTNLPEIVYTHTKILSFNLNRYIILHVDYIKYDYMSIAFVIIVIKLVFDLAIDIFTIFIKLEI